MEQDKFRRSYERKPRKKLNALRIMKESQEAAEKIQNSEKYDIVQNIKGFLLLGQDDVESYSSIDEIMDRNIYDPEPLVFAGDLVQSKELEVGSKYINIFDEKEQENFQKEVFVARPKVEPGAIQTFVTRNYDAYLHNLNLDQARSWEIYFPHNNIGVVLDALEAERLKKLAKVHHLPEALMKNLKFANDKSKSDPRTMRLAVLNPQKPLAGKKKSSQDSLQDPGQSQMYVIPARNRASGGAEKREEEKPERSDQRLRSFKTVQNTRRKIEIKRSYSDVEDNVKENIPPNEEIRTEKEDEKSDGKEDEKLLKKDIKEESPSLAAEVEEEEIEERSEDSREYCKKVLGSDYDGLMKKFTDMLAESMKKVNDDDSK